MKKQGLDPDLLDIPDKVLRDQVGLEDKEIKNDIFEKGLR